MNGPLRVGVIGVGVMGAEHARLLTHEVAGSTAAAVFDVDHGRATGVARQFGARVIDDPADLIGDAEVDAVLVASIDDTHEELVLACIEAGKPVLCEKPLAPDVAACDRMIAAEVAARRRLVSVGFMRRFDPGYVQAKAAATELGRTLMVHNIHRNATSNAGHTSYLITGSAVHEIDIMRWLLEDEIVAVSVYQPTASSAARVQDPLFLVLTTAGGVTADVEVFVTAQYGYDVRCEVVAEGGAVVVDTPPPIVASSNGRVGRPVAADWRPRFADAYRRELQDWVDAVRSGSVSGCASAWDGRAATVVAQAAVEALTAGTVSGIDVGSRPSFYADRA